MIVGLTGSVGSGKSTVARLMEDLVGAWVIDADAIVYRLQEPQAEGFRQILAEFGPQYFTKDGLLDRKALAEHVFNNTEKLEKLNALLHPLVWDALNKELQDAAHREWVVLMVPLLFETGMDKLADVTLVVVMDDAVRLQRLKDRSGWSEDDINRRLAAQMPQTEKIRRADFVVQNNADLESLRAQITQALPLIRQKVELRAASGS